MSLILIAYSLRNHVWLKRYSVASLLLLLDYLLLSPIDCIVPKADSSYPEYTKYIDGSVLELPGPLSRMAGEINPSRPRLKYILYYQTKHEQPSAWTIDFNGLSEQSDCFSETRRIDPKARFKEQNEIGDPKCWDNVQWVVIHNSKKDLTTDLKEMNYSNIEHKDRVQLWMKK